MRSIHFQPKELMYRTCSIFRINQPFPFWLLPICCSYKNISQRWGPNKVMWHKLKQNMWYNWIALQVFGNSPSSDMMEKFRDILAFCQQVSRLMVSEMRRRASNQSTEAASCAIVKFLEIENSEESSNGWMLLSALNLLAAGDVSLVQVRWNLKFLVLNQLLLFTLCVIFIKNAWVCVYGNCVT